jgi:BirA family transcriptional regulator, biotin operon repressor / biotin---[acetyl-CoA-carboxylase] ligase
MIHKISPTMVKVLNALNDGEWHTGSDMASSLGISRTAIWKIINRLKKYNIDIQSQHQGYQLSAPHILLQKKQIENFIKSHQTSLEIYEILPSTSDYLKRKQPLKAKNICLAEYQTQGKGRLGREWASPFGRNIYCSLSYMFNKDISELSGLSLAVGVLVAQALEVVNPLLNPLLKWPNDIYIGQQKVGGILIELMAEANGKSIAIISFGLNVNMKDEPLAINQPWTSLEHVLNEKLDRNIAVGHLLAGILDGMELFAKKGFGAFKDQWTKYDTLVNKQVNITMGKDTTSGIAKGIDNQGYLLLQLTNGQKEKFSCGDTSLIKK